MHSAAYDEGFPLDGKRVAVIGAGSSGVQIVAKLSKTASHIFHWIRSPIWITAGFAQTWAGKDGANFEYTDEQLKYLEQHPQKYMEYRKQIENELNQRFKFILKGSQEAKAAREFSYEQMARHLKGDPRLIDKIIPKVRCTEYDSSFGVRNCWCPDLDLAELLDVAMLSQRHLRSTEGPLGACHFDDRVRPYLTLWRGRQRLLLPAFLFSCPKHSLTIKLVPFVEFQSRLQTTDTCSRLSRRTRCSKRHHLHRCHWVDHGERLH